VRYGETYLSDMAYVPSATIALLDGEKQVRETVSRTPSPKAHGGKVQMIVPLLCASISSARRKKGS
jgi:hypothetical protein